MQFSSLFLFVAIAIGATNGVALSLNQRGLVNAPLPAVGAASVYSRDNLLNRAVTASSLESQASAAALTASPGLMQAQAAMSGLDVNSVTLEQMKPVIAQITSAISPASKTFTSLAAQAKTLTANSKRQGPDFNKAIDQLVIDLNKTLVTATPLVAHLTANLDLGTVQDLVIALSPTLATLILGVEGLLISLAPGLSTIVDPLLVTIYGLTDSLGINLNLPAPPSN